MKWIKLEKKDLNLSKRIKHTTVYKNKRDFLSEFVPDSF